jgi:carbonic anhydrase/acetyltransferase-like protein (isoleucine patch superfamily)
MSGPLVDLFGLSLGEAPIAGKTLSEWQDEARHEVARLRLGDSVLVSTAFADEFEKASSGVDGPTTPRIALGAAHEAFGPNVFGAEIVDGALAYAVTLGAAGPEPHLVEMSVLDTALASPQPGRMTTPILAPRGDRIIWAIGHWTDLLVANLLMLQSVVLGNTGNEIDSTADVHPTAIVERCRVGADVRVGPYAVISDAHLGAGTVVMEHASVARSQLGAGCVVQTGALVHDSVVGDTTVLSFHTATRGSVLLGHSTISAAVVARSVIGRDVFLARGMQIGASTLADEPVRVRVGRRSISTGIRLLGCGVGSGSRIGGGVALSPGYEVPPDTYLVERPAPRVAEGAASKTPLVHVDNEFRRLGFSAPKPS